MSLLRNLLLVSGVNESHLLKVSGIYAAFITLLTSSIIPASTRAWYAPREKPFEQVSIAVYGRAETLRTEQKYMISRLIVFREPTISCQNDFLETPGNVSVTKIFHFPYDTYHAIARSIELSIFVLSRVHVCFLDGLA